MIEQGVVRSVRGTVADVQVVPVSPEACASCGGACGLSHDYSAAPEERLVEVQYEPGLEPGRRVLLEVEEQGSLGPALVVFFVPVIALVIGALLGSRLPALTGLSFLGPTGFAILSALVLFLVSVAVVRAYDRHVVRRGRKPRILRIER